MNEATTTLTRAAPQKRELTVKQLLNESQNAISSRFRGYWLGWGDFLLVLRGISRFAGALIPGFPE